MPEGEARASSNEVMSTVTHAALLQPPPADELRRSLAELVAERQRLRASGAGRAALEANRRAIVRAQWELAAALLAERAA